MPIDFPALTFEIETMKQEMADLLAALLPLVRLPGSDSYSKIFELAKCIEVLESYIKIFELAKRIEVLESVTTVTSNAATLVSVCRPMEILAQFIQTLPQNKKFESFIKKIEHSIKMILLVLKAQNNPLSADSFTTDIGEMKKIGDCLAAYAVKIRSMDLTEIEKRVGDAANEIQSMEFKEIAEDVYIAALKMRATDLSDVAAVLNDSAKNVKSAVSNLQEIRG